MLAGRAAASAAVEQPSDMTVLLGSLRDVSADQEGVTFIGLAWSELRLLALAFALEKAAYLAL